MNKLCFSVIFVVEGAKIYLVKNVLEGLKLPLNPPVLELKSILKLG
jgi:hypothetical protein